MSDEQDQPNQAPEGATPSAISEAKLKANKANSTKPAAPGKRRGRPFKDPEKQRQAVELANRIRNSK